MFFEGGYTHTNPPVCKREKSVVFFNGIKKEEVVWEDYIDHQLIKWVRNNKGTLKALLFCVVVVFPPLTSFLFAFVPRLRPKRKHLIPPQPDNNFAQG
jgi:pantothenate kinase type III